MKDIFPYVIVGCLAALPVILIMKMHHPVRSLGIDQTCLSHCTQRGFSTDYCQTRCSLDPDVQVQSGGDPADPRCMERCQNAGREQSYCEKACRYY